MSPTRDPTLSPGPSAAAESEDAFDPEIARDLESDYEILGELGRGASAVVYRARDRALGREVAIKVVRARGPAGLPAGPAGEGVESPADDESLARLAREARTVARLQHPNIVGVHAVRRLRQGGLALVMQLVPGRTLKQAVREDGTFAPDRAERVIRDVAEALAAAHALGIVHRDVKPENIFLDGATGRALLSDFGIARSDEVDARLTQTGTAIGTPAYMSPEQIDGAAVDPRTDVYSLGLVAWEMLTGRQPWEGVGLFALLGKQKSEALPPIDAVRPRDAAPVSLRLQYIVERMLQKRPAARWAGADAVVSVLGHSVLPADYQQWLRAHRQRVEAHRRGADGRAAATPAALVEAALATVRLTRSRLLGGSAPPTAPTDPTAPASDPSAANADEQPDWERNAAPRRSRRAVAGALALLLGAVAVGALVLQRADGGEPATPPIASVTSDAGAIQVPVHGAAESLATPVSPPVATPPVTAPASVPLDTSAPPITPAAPEPAARPSRDAAPPVPSPDPRAAPRGAGPAVAVRPAEEPATSRGATASRAAGSRAAASPAAAPSTPPAQTERAAAPDAESMPAARPPVRVAVERGLVAAGGRHSCALAGDGRAYCWGANDRGQLGATDPDGQPAPARVAGDIRFAQLSAGVAHTCGVTRSGDAYCWGNDEHGELGDATTTSRDAPVRVAGSFAFRVVRAGRSHSCGIVADGPVACWGLNADGQLGDGTTTTRTSPTLAAGTARFVEVSAGWRHTCAVAADGVAYCWGSNDAGQLGDGTRGERRTPTAVAGPHRFVSIAAGAAHTCAVATTGEAYCWGRNSAGQLGTGGGPDRASPTKVQTTGRFASVVAGSVHSCARAVGGQVVCWGRNTYGQLGDGTTVDRATPVRVGGGAFVSVSASGAHTCAATAAGDVSCWGYNVDGQLGDGSRNHRPIPGRVPVSDQ